MSTYENECNSGVSIRISLWTIVSTSARVIRRILDINGNLEKVLIYHHLIVISLYKNILQIGRGYPSLRQISPTATEFRPPTVFTLEKKLLNFSSD